MQEIDETFSDPIIGILLDYHDIQEIHFTRKGKEWQQEVLPADTVLASTALISDFFADHLPDLEKVCPGELYAAHYFREESGKPVRDLIPKPELS